MILINIPKLNILWFGLVKCIPTFVSEHLLTKTSNMNVTSFTERQIEIMEAATHRIDSHGIQELTIKNLAADLNLSEAALYRHFKSKNEILLGLITYFVSSMNKRLAEILTDEEQHPSEQLKAMFDSQLKTFVKKPAIISIIFSEGIFQFNKELTDKVSGLMDIMRNNIISIIKKGQEQGVYAKLLAPETIATIVMGSMRMVVLKWKISGHKSNLVNDGKVVLSGLLKMLES